jgi:hypothetical protein
VGLKKINIMKNKELFDRTIGILVNAYLKGTLEHYNCYACAVGNIVAANCGYDLVKGNPNSMDYYMGYAGTLTFNPPLKFEHILTRYVDDEFERVESPIAKEHLQKTGYLLNEIAAIEAAFEISSMGMDKDEHMFAGLMSVCDALMEIHEATAEETAEAKLLFTKVPA